MCNWHIGENSRSGFRCESLVNSGPCGRRDRGIAPEWGTGLRGCFSAASTQFILKNNSRTMCKFPASGPGLFVAVSGFASITAAKASTRSHGQAESVFGCLQKTNPGPHPRICRIRFFAAVPRPASGHGLSRDWDCIHLAVLPCHSRIGYKYQSHIKRTRSGLSARDSVARGPFCALRLEFQKTLRDLYRGEGGPKLPSMFVQVLRGE